MEQARKACLDKILSSDSQRKLIIAGAGTGKSFTFKCLLKKNGGKNLALTFINALASDMAKDLGDLAEARTFHSFCRKLLHKLPADGIDHGFHFFPKLKQIVERDAEILEVKIDDVETALMEAFQSLNESDGRIGYFLNRANFYNAVGFDDSVYRVLSAFRKGGDHIPAYDHVVVDEFQDFNALEVEFIEHLAARNRILIVGDDDQAIYDFRNASPDHLRKKTQHTEYEQFALPFCSRCPEVVVKATNHILELAKKNGKLAGRIDKEYHCYLPDKGQDSKRYPHLVRVTCSTQRKNAPYLGMYIEKVIREIPKEDVQESKDKNYPLALVIGPSHYLKQVNEYLKERFKKILYKTALSQDLTFLDGYVCLVKNSQSNLGWRVIAELEDSEVAFNVVRAAASNGSRIVDELAAAFVERHGVRLELLTRLSQNRNALSAGEQSDLEQYFEVPMDEIFRRVKATDDEVETDLPTDNGGSSDNDDPVIQLTTYNGCKGLSAGHVFVIGLEHGVFPKNNSPSDNEICQFVVALTRTRKQCHLVTVKNFSGNWTNPSAFQSWLAKEFVTDVAVKKDFFS